MKFEILNLDLRFEILNFKFELTFMGAPNSKIERVSLLKSGIALFTLFAAFITSPPLWAVQYADNPGGDQPDYSFTLGDALYPTRLENITPNIDAKAPVAVLDNGYSRETMLFIGLYLPVRMIKETEFSTHNSSILLFIIPSGGLSYLNDPEGFRIRLNRFVEEGGILLVFAQRFGRDYALAPAPEDEPVQGYGWLEDQSSIAHSSILTMQHPVVAGLATSKPHVNIDGFFMSFPRNARPVLRNAINGQPVMLIYRHGKGNVLASALFTDWAYLHTRATWDEVAIFSHFLRWGGFTLSPSAPKKMSGSSAKGSVLPTALPPLGFSIQSDNEIYMAGSTATFAIHLWNNGSRKRKIKVYLDGIGHNVELSPHGSAQINHSTSVYSSRRLWVYFYDEEGIFLQTLRKGYTVVYPVSEADEGG